MAPVKTDLALYQGDRYELFFRLRDETPEGEPGAYRDLTGCVVRAQVRDPADELATEFTCTVVDQAISPGSVMCVLTPAQTAALTPGTKYVWDLEMQWAGGADFVETLFSGAVAVTKEVTRVNAG